MRKALVEDSVLLCDANFSSLPLLFSARNFSRYVHTCGNASQDPCHQYSDSAHFIDYSSREDLLTLVKDLRISRLIPGCNDYSYLSCAWVAEQVGLSGYDDYETTLILLHKDRFRNLAQRRGYPVPKAVASIEETAGFNYPLLVKPTDSFSGRGIQKLYHSADILTAIERARAFSVTNSVVIEEFKEGGLYSHSAFIGGGRIIGDFFVSEYCTVYPYQVNSSCLAARLTDALKAQVRACIEQLVNDLGLVDGLLHTQFIACDDQFWLIEVTRRCPGDLYSKLIFDSTGVDYTDLYIRGFLGRSLPEVIQRSANRYVARHTASVKDAGIFISLRHDIADAAVHAVQLKKTGEPIKSAPFDKAAILFVEFNSEEKLTEITPRLNRFVSVNVLGPERWS